MRVSIGVVIFIFCLFQANGYEQGHLRRALDNLQEWREYKKRGLVDCKPMGVGCSRIIPCCGTTQCFWMKGWSAVKDGECVPCVERGEYCQEDGQCCGHLQCDKGNALWMDGTCQRYRRQGDCYRDGQCVNDCKKPWYKTHGKCT